MDTVERLKVLFSVTPEGRLVRLVKTCRTNKAGDVAGNINVHGYAVVGIDGKQYYAHRVIAAMTLGEWPKGQVDHTNGDRADNRPENLRMASNSQNQQNSRLRSSNTSGVKGVYWHSQNKNWYAQIWVNKRAVTVGSFDRLEDAATAVSTARAAHHGEFARTA